MPQVEDYATEGLSSAHNSPKPQQQEEIKSMQDDDADSDLSDYGSDEFQKLNIHAQNHVKFILNVPMYVPASNMDEASSDDTDDESFTADQFAFNIQDPSSFPYRTFDIITKPIKSKKKNKPEPKKIMEDRVGLLEIDPPIDEPFYQDKARAILQHSKTDTLLKLIVAEGLYEVDKDYINNIAVSIGLNRYKSLSSRKNDCLTKELHCAEDKSSISFKKAAFFWDIPWTDKEGNKLDKEGKEPLYYEAKNFYKQLKRKDAVKAKNFLEINEGLYRPSPPYQQIREYVKNHENTKELVHTLRTDGSIIYFSSIDSDTKSFNGIYSSYLKIIAKSQKPPTVMSTGYEFAEDYDGFPLHVGSKLERIIRIVTAETLSGGAYYPEPNFCVLIPDGEDTLPYSFIDKKIVAANLESPTLLRQILQSPDCILVFSKNSPLITSGDRAKKSEPEFSDRFQNGGVPNADDLSKLSQIIQSTANPRDWALGVYYNRCFKIKGNTGSFNKHITALFKEEGIELVLSELKKMVVPSNMVDLLYQAIKEVSFIKNKFYHPFEESSIEDDELYEEILTQFYKLSSSDILTIIEITDTPEIYRALNAHYSLYEICRIYAVPEKFMAVFSKKSEIISKSTEGIFEDITYRDLEELYDQILLNKGTAEDFEELLNDDYGLFAGKYGDLDFNEVTEYLLSYLQLAQNIIDYDSALDNKSAYEVTADHFAFLFEKDYGNESEEGTEETLDNIYAVDYPEGSYEYFQQSILGYGNRFQKLLENTNFVAASNNVPRYRNDILQKLPSVVFKLKTYKEDVVRKSSIDLNILDIIESCPKEWQLPQCYDIKNVQLIHDIDEQISALSGLEKILLYSLESFPDSTLPLVDLTGATADL